VVAVAAAATAAHLRSAWVRRRVRSVCWRLSRVAVVRLGRKRSAYGEVYQGGRQTGRRLCGRFPAAARGKTRNNAAQWADGSEENGQADAGPSVGQQTNGRDGERRSCSEAPLARPICWCDFSV
jgi:hypothetical protein